MRGTLGLLLVAAVAAGCSSGHPTGDPDPTPDPLLSVGGVYETEVSLVDNDCPGQTVQQHETVVRHTPGAAAMSLLHASSVYNGSVTADGAFSTEPVTQVFGGITYTIGITGQFTATTLDAVVQVGAARQPPCAFTARWAGPKTGGPNVIP